MGANANAMTVAEAATPARRLPWYVIQVQSGRERAICKLIADTCAVYNASAGADAPVSLEECFSPSFATQKKVRGEWVRTEHLLLPGYVIAVTDTPERLADRLRGIRELSRLITAGGQYVPLNDAERLWLELHTQRGDRVVAMSFGYKEGDVLCVTEGPLRGQEGRITKVDRKNSLAHVEMHVGAMTIRTTVGLGVLPKE